jgi:hypothetical protein
MANRFWVGGTGTWTSSSTTNWSTTSGGASGASAPTSVDDVYFDANSNTGTNPFTLTISTNAACLSWNVSGVDGVMTIAGTVNTFSVYGDIFLQATNLNVTFSGAIRLRAAGGTRFITTNGNPLPSLRVEPTSSGTIRLASSITLNGNVYPNIELISGTLNLNGWNATLTGTSVSNISGLGSTSRILNLGSSSVFCYSTSNPINLTGSNYGIIANSSFIYIYGNSATISESLATAYNYVQFQPPTAIGTRSLATGSSFSQLVVYPGTVAGIYPFTLSSNITINTLQLIGSGSNPAIRHLFSSNSSGTARTISSTFSYFLQYADFRDITSASVVWSGTSLGNLGNNTNINFSAAKTVYWNLAGTQNWSAVGWATSSGGAPALANFPLAQDTAIFDDSGAAGTITVDANYAVGTLDTSARTLAATINASSTLNLYLNLLVGSGLTFSGNLSFQGVNTSSITSNGNTIGAVISCQKNVQTTILRLLDNFSNSATVSIISGNFQTNNYNLSVSTFNTGSSNKILSFGSSTINVNGSGNTFDVTGSGTTFSSNTATLLFNSASPKTFSSTTNFIFNNLIQNGAGTLSIRSAYCTNISTNVLPTTINFYLFNVFTNFNLNGTPGNLLTLGNANTVFGNTYSLRAVIITLSPSARKVLDYVNVSGLQFENPSGGVNTVSWYATNSTNSGNNQGILFSDTSKKILYILTGTSFVLPSDWNPNNNRIFLVGGGGSGGPSYNSASGGGGGGGGFTLVQNYAAPPGATVSYSIGSGGYYANGGSTTWASTGYPSLFAGGGAQAPYTVFPFNIAGTGGSGTTFNGGAGGTGVAYTGSSSYTNGGGGGGGSGGPLGNGATGGNGFSSFSNFNAAGGGGGGNGGGSVGQNGTSNLGGAGGNNASGVGGGSASGSYSNPGSAGGGASGNTQNFVIGTLIPSTGSDIAGSFGTSGGAGGGGYTSGNNAVYDFANSANGAGGGGGGFNFGGTYNPGQGGNGIIVVEYTPNTDFLMFMSAR